MKIGDKVILVQTTEHYSRGVVGSTYKISVVGVNVLVEYAYFLFVLQFCIFNYS